MGKPYVAQCTDSKKLIMSANSSYRTRVIVQIANKSNYSNSNKLKFLEKLSQQQPTKCWES